MDQEFDGKGLTPYDPAHNSTYLLAGKNLTTISVKSIGGWTWERKGKQMGENSCLPGGYKGSFSGGHGLPNSCKIANIFRSRGLIF